MPTAQHGRASIEIAAPPQAVYDLIADVTRMGEWSPECYRCVARRGERRYSRGEVSWIQPDWPLPMGENRVDLHR